MFGLLDRPLAELEVYSSKKRRVLAFWFASLWCGVAVVESFSLLIRKGGAMPVTGRISLGLVATFFLALWGYGLRERERLERRLAAGGMAEERQALVLDYGILIRRMTVSAILAFAGLKVAVVTGLAPR